MYNGREVAQSICDWLMNYAKILENDAEFGNSYAGLFFSFAGTLQTMINDGVYGG